MDIIEYNIMGLIKENEIAYINERKITWKKTSRFGYDTKLFKIEEPEPYGKYCRISNNILFFIK